MACKRSAVRTRVAPPEKVSELVSDVFSGDPGEEPLVRWSEAHSVTQTQLAY